MPRNSRIYHPEGVYFTKNRAEYVKITGNRCAAILLDAFEFWETGNIDQHKSREVQITYAQLEEALLEEFSEQTIRRALHLLREKGFLKIGTAKAGDLNLPNRYLLVPETINAAIMAEYWRKWSHSIPICRYWWFHYGTTPAVEWFHRGTRGVPPWKAGGSTVEDTKELTQEQHKKNNDDERSAAPPVASAAVVGPRSPEETQNTEEPAAPVEPGRAERPFELRPDRRPRARKPKTYIRTETNTLPLGWTQDDVRIVAQDMNTAIGRASNVRSWRPANEDDATTLIRKTNGADFDTIQAFIAQIIQNRELASSQRPLALLIFLAGKRLATSATSAA
jgi:hypothetical protein